MDSGHNADVSVVNSFGERIRDNAFFEKAARIQSATITCPISWFYVPMDWICKHKGSSRYRPEPVSG
jgi:hypothetical protein